MDMKQKKQITMLSIVVVPNIISAAGLILELAGKAKELARILRKIAKVLCVPFCLAAAILAVSDWKREENLENHVLALWIAFHTVLTLRVFERPDDEEETE